jgi:guanylate kinase
MGKLVSSDPITKTTRSFHKGQRDGEEYYIYNEQDVTHIIEKNKHLYNPTGNGETATRRSRPPSGATYSVGA